MKILEQVEGRLSMDVSSEGNYICRNTPVVVQSIVDNFNNLSILITSMSTKVRLQPELSLKSYIL